MYSGLIVLMLLHLKCGCCMFHKLLCQSEYYILSWVCPVWASLRQHPHTDPFNSFCFRSESSASLRPPICTQQRPQTDHTQLDLSLITRDAIICVTPLILSRCRQMLSCNSTEAASFIILNVAHHTHSHAFVMIFNIHLPAVAC